MANKKAYSVLIMVMFVWGVNVPAIKYLTTQASPISMTSIRIFIAAIVVFAILKAMGLIRRLTKKEWGYILIGALLNVAIHHSLMAIGVSMTTGANASLIIGTGPMLTAVLGSLLLKNMPTIIQWLGFGIGMAGISITVLLSGGEVAAFSVGDLLVFLSIFSQVFSFIIISKASKTIDPRLLTAYMFLVGSIILAITGMIFEPNGFREMPYTNTAFWIVLIISGALATAVGHMLYNNTIPQVGAAKAAIFINFNTLFALVGSALILGEPVTYVHGIGLVLIVIGVLFGSGSFEYFLNRKEVKE
ncbi:DMT family transporter [Solibacillus silvestris]|uniref:DMT family transporter n=1 Tax=Solibacillus silvestris TaxID=76853 RepID=UPI003F7D9E56